MSSMLEQAIVDAEQLKNAARQTAEEAVVEKYQDQIREAVEQILEQEELDLGTATEVELGTDEDGQLAMIDDLPAAQTADPDEIVAIDLDKLEELMAEADLDPADMLEREEVAQELDALTEDDEEITLDETVLESILEVFAEEADIEESTKKGDKIKTGKTKGEEAYKDPSEGEKSKTHKGDEDYTTKKGDKIKTGKTKGEEAYKYPSKDEKSKTHKGEEDYTTKKGGKIKTGKTKGEEAYKYPSKGEKKKDGGKAYKRDTRDDMGGGHGDYKTAQKKPNFPYQENKRSRNETNLIKEQKQLNGKVQLLEKKLNKYGTVIKQLKDKLNESNLINAKLLYQNRILNSVSLNERQKTKIVETISNATTVEEAKIIFETLQSAVGSGKKRQLPESLNEVVTRSSSAFLPRREETAKVDPFAERMRILAGLDNK